MKTAFLVSVLAISFALSSIGAAQNPQNGERLDLLQLDPNFYMIAGAGANIAIQLGPEGAVVVDAGSARMADAVVATIKKLTDLPVRYIIDTSADPDHVGGNEKVARAGKALGNIASSANNGAAGIIAAESVLNRMSEPVAGKAPYPTVAWPTETFADRQKSLYLNNEGIQVLYQPAAHSDGDGVVFFRRSDVLVTGEIFDVTHFPRIDVDNGGSIQGEIDALNRLLDIAIPSIPLPFKDGGTRVIPARGRICEQAELVEYRDMVTIVRNSVRRLVSKGLTLDQIKAANPTQGYRSRYGSDAGPWTTDMFVEAIYKGLATKAGQK
jgi:glyoxylase-like metal-dependent hydrolase (beta-lactamase superfamily II)